MEKIYYRKSSDRDMNLFFIIQGVQYSIDKINEYNIETNGGFLDLNEEIESVYGMAFIAMQNYINMISIDTLFISGIDKSSSRNFSNSCENYVLLVIKFVSTQNILK